MPDAAPAATPTAVPARVRATLSGADDGLRREESEIRRAVEASRHSGADLPARAAHLALDAPGAVVELAVAAIRKAGFDPQPLADKPGAAPMRR
jgi:Cd2+/Zn2+-exporting ATPase